MVANGGETSMPRKMPKSMTNNARLQTSFGYVCPSSWRMWHFRSSMAKNSWSYFMGLQRVKNAIFWWRQKAHIERWKKGPNKFVDANHIECLIKKGDSRCCGTNFAHQCEHRVDDYPYRPTASTISLFINLPRANRATASTVHDHRIQLQDGQPPTNVRP